MPPRLRPQSNGAHVRVASAFAVLTTAILITALTPRAGFAEPVDFGSPDARMRVYWLNSRLVVGVYPRSNEGYIQLARRVMTRPEDYADVEALNRNRPVMTGRPVVFPIATLQPELWSQALRALYPEDELTERGWAHTVTDPLESLIQLTEAYTGSARRFRELAQYNQLRNPDVLKPGDEIVIPLHWIPDELGFRPVRLADGLKLDKDPKSGQLFASYTVAPNDTLYSLLLRYTDRERADELNRMSRLLLKLNGLSDENRLLAGNALRIPLEWIDSEHHVAGHAPVRRLTPLEPQEPPLPGNALRPPKPAPPKRARSPFEPIHVIVDAGHGGGDPGAVYGKRGSKDHVFEHELVHDVAERVAALLRSKGFEVYPTVEDPSHTYPVAKLSPAAFGREQVRVSPPYRMDSARVAVNMRVFFINALFRRLTDAGVPPEHVVLVSLHGDALAPTLRGAMIYYPDHRLRAKEFYPKGRVYRLRSEAVPTRLFFSREDNRAAEGYSRDFGQQIVQSFKDHRLGVSPRKSVRPYYYRNGERTLPAVLRYSQIPTSVLVEVANLNNRSDRLAMLNGNTRQKVAQALAAALEALRRERTGPIVTDKSS